MLRVNALTLATLLVAGCAQLPPDLSSQFVPVPLPVRDNHGITRSYMIVWPERCLIPDPTAEPMLGENLPPGCANDYNLSQMIERPSDLNRGRQLGAGAAAPAVRAAQKYLYGGEGPLGAGVSSAGSSPAAPPDQTKELSGVGGAGGGKSPLTETASGR